MNDWLRANAISIIMALATLISTYAIYGYRLQALEDRQNRQGVTITALQDKANDTNIALAHIQTDIEYIKVQINKLVK